MKERLEAAGGTPEGEKQREMLRRCTESAMKMAVENERLREALDELGHAADEFLTDASYTVTAEAEEELVAALEHGRNALAGGPPGGEGEE